MVTESYLDTTPDFKKAGEVYSKIMKEHGLAPRVPQKDMIADIITALLFKKVALIEAFTGFGKTLGEVLAAAFVSSVTREPVAIATPRKDLQSALVDCFEKMIHPHFKKLKVAVLKGKSNYISMAKLLRLEEEIETHPEYREHFAEFMAAIDDNGGDIELCRSAFVPLEPLGIPIDTLHIASASSHIDDIKYYAQAKETAKNADVLIINHTLLAVIALQNCRASKNNAELPFKMSRIIIDEGHMLAEAVRSYLSATLAFSTVSREMKELSHNVAKQRKKFTGQQKLIDSAETAEHEIKDLSRKLAQIYEQREILTYFNISSALARGHFSDLINQTVKILLKIRAEISNVLTRARRHKKYLGLKAMGAMDNLADMDSIFANYLFVLDQTRMRKQLSSGAASSDDTLFLITFSPIEHYPSMLRMKRDIGPWLFNAVWSKMDGCALLSGTLADANSFGGEELTPCFHTVKQDTGLIFIKSHNFLGKIYPLSQKWDKIDILIYKNSPLRDESEKNDFTRECREKHLQFVAQNIISTLEVSSGGALVLCPSYEDVNILYSMLRDTVKRDIVAQGITNYSIQSCIDSFSNASHEKLLIGTGLWQGIDLPGEALTELFIVRVPWLSPESPEFQSRVKKVPITVGEKTVMKFVGNDIIITEVFWKFRQGVGRLPRLPSDKGHIRIFDPRILTDNKKYRAFMYFLTSTFDNVQIVE